jgi:glycosyltransferase involved in cell wall biosynthesis
MTPETGDKPLLTFAVVAFNQERFIREAVQAALAQTYSPLEIVLSDDCSEDRTFELMREMAATYTGPHRVMLNRNPARKSIGGHVNRVVEISHGELIIGAAGDDVSLPQRAQAAFEAWKWSGGKATSIHTDFIQIDENGGKIERKFKVDNTVGDGRFAVQAVEPPTYVRTLKPVVFGCTHTFSRRLFNIFGGLPEDVIHEDDALAFRSVLAGQLVYINEPLVKYRLHGSNIYVRDQKRGVNLNSIAQQEDRHRRDFRSREIMHQGFLHDAEKAKGQGLIGAVDYEQTIAEAARRQRRFSLMGEYLKSGFFGKCRILSSLRKEGLDEQESRFLYRRLMPHPLFLRMRFACNYADWVMKRGGFRGSMSGPN